MANKVTIKDIAEIAGVSKATVSFFLNGKYNKMSAETYQRIQNAIDQTGYSPSVAARSLNDKSPHLFGVIIGNITKPFANRIVKGIEDYADESSYMTIVASSEFETEKEMSYIKSMLALGVDGFLIQPTVNFNEIRKTLTIDKPIVFFDSAPSGEDQMYVKTDNYLSVRNATSRLIEKGYEHFIIISYNPDILQTRIERSKGCTDLLEETGIGYDLIILPSDADQSQLIPRLYPLLDQYRNVCIFTLNSTLLQLTWTVLTPYRSRIPEIGLIGYDHETWCDYVVPSITTISQPSYEEGYTAAQILMDAIHERHEIDHVQVLKSELRERQSTDLQKKADPDR